jgi:hypothetical protein
MKIVAFLLFVLFSSTLEYEYLMIMVYKPHVSLVFQGNISEQAVSGRGTAMHSSYYRKDKEYFCYLNKCFGAAYKITCCRY